MALDLSALDDASVVRPALAANGVAALGALALFQEDPDNPRFEESPQEFAAFVADVRERGILQPIVVRRLDDGRLRIRFGARRYRAAVQLALAQIPYVVTEDPRQFDGYAQVAENERRLALQPLELATFIAKRVALGESRKDVGSRLGMHPSTVTHLLCLTGEVPPFLMELYHTRRCRTPQYLYRLQQLWRQDAQLVEQACAEAGEVGGPLIKRIQDSLEVAAAQGGSSTKGRMLAKEPLAPPSGSGPRAQGGAGDGEPVTVIAPVEPRQGPRSSGRLHRPMLFGTFAGRAVQIDLRVRPSCDGRVAVRYCDGGTVLEVDIGAITLTNLVEGTR